MKKTLIVNADDFGQSDGINKGIIRAHRDGIVTSTSLMVRWPAAPDAARLATEYPGLAIGLHLDFGEWFFRNGEWIAVYEVVPLDNEKKVKEEIDRQVSAFRRLVGTNPTHIDSHQHCHSREPARSFVLQHAKEMGIPVRQCSPRISYYGSFYGQDSDGSPLRELITTDNILKIVAELPNGITELGCHPGEDCDGLETMYRSERAQELQVLCDPRVRKRIEQLDIRLCSFAELDHASNGEHR